MYRKLLAALIGFVIALLSVGAVYQAFFRSEPEPLEKTILPDTITDLGDFRVTIFRGHRAYRHVKLTVSVEAYNPVAKSQIESKKQELRDVFIREINSYLNIQYHENSDPQIREVKNQKNINDFLNLKKRLKLVARRFFDKRVVKDIFIVHYVARRR